MFRRGQRRRWAMNHPLAASNPPALQALRQANLLKDQGRYNEAASLFEQLGNGAQNRGMFRRAPQLYLQAAHCQLLAGQPKRGFEQIKQGLGLLASLQDWPLLLRAGKIMTGELHRLGYPEAAAEVQSWLDKTLPAAQLPNLASDVEKHRSHPPEKCPYCGATVRADLVEWIDEVTVKCVYCDSAIGAEG